MKIKCHFCEAKTINEFHAAAVHTKAYHDLLFKIYEKREKLKKEINEMDELQIKTEFVSMIKWNEKQIEVLESLLENEK